MLKLSKKFHVGCRVLFLWNSIALTGVVTSVTGNSFGIKCDSDIYTTDRLMIPRLNDEIFVEKGKCLKTGEIAPIRIKNGEIDELSKFPDVTTAFYHLPKMSIFPLSSGIDKSRFIDFIPERHVFKIIGGGFYLYTELSPGHFTLVNVNDKTMIRIPDWRYQKSINHLKTDTGITVCEYNIEKIFYIPDRFINKNISNLIRFSLIDLIYNINTWNDIPIVHPVRTKKDVDPKYLPKEIIIDPNGFKK